MVINATKNASSMLKTRILFDSLHFIIYYVFFLFSEQMKLMFFKRSFFTSHFCASFNVNTNFFLYEFK